MTLIGAALPILFAVFPPPPLQQVAVAQDRAAVVRRVAATATLAAQEYRIGVVDGRVVAPAEVEESRLFLQEARRSAGGLPSDSANNPVATLDSLLALVKRLAPPDTLDAGVRALATGLAERLRRFARRAAGANPGPHPRRGDLPPQLRGLSRRPRSGRRTDGGRPRAGALESRGVDGAPGSVAARLLPPGQHRRRSALRCRPSRIGCRPQDRWAAALYASTLRLPPVSGEVPSALRSFARTGKMSDAELLDSLGAVGGRLARRPGGAGRGALPPGGIPRRR